MEDEDKVTPGRIRFRYLEDVDKAMPRGWIPYIAGLLDGEGTFSIVKTGKNPSSFQAHIRLQMTHEETVKRFAAMCGVSYLPNPSARGKTPAYYAMIGTQDDVEKLLNMLKKWLITKRRHADLILEFISLKKKLEDITNMHGPSTEKNMLRMVDIYVELRKLNPKDPQRSRVDYDKLRETLRKQVAEYLAARIKRL